jgi:hypothetical protein
MLADKGAAKIVEDAITQQLIVYLVDRKFGVQDDYPRYRFEDISRMRGVELAEMLSSLKSSGIIRYDRKLEEFARSINDLPEIDEATREEPQQFGEFGPVGNEPTPSNVKDQVNGLTRAKAPTTGPSLEEAQTAVEPFWREPLPHERFVEWEAMKGGIVLSPMRAWTIVEPVRQKMARITAKRVAAMSDAEIRKGRVAIPLQGKLTEWIEPSFVDSYASGYKSVLSEMKRQRSQPNFRIAATAKQDDIEQEIEDEMEEFERSLSKERRGRIGVIASVFVVGMLKAMESEALREGAVVRQKQLGFDEEAQALRIERSILDLSENVIKSKLSAAMTTAFQVGREEAAEQLGDRIETAFYSAMMDDGTESCADAGGTCMALDGQEHRVGDPEFATPNPNCAGGWNCRCVNIYVFREERKAA